MEKGKQITIKGKSMTHKIGLFMIYPCELVALPINFFLCYYWVPYQYVSKFTKPDEVDDVTVCEF